MKKKSTNKKSIHRIKNSTSGITLIALVITIIVLLILAGASLSAVLGENGIINKAVGAKKEFEIASAKESIELAVLEMQMDKRAEKEYCSLEYVKDNISNSLPDITIVGSKGNPIDKLYVKQDGHQFEIRQDGEVVYIGDVEFNEIPDLAIIRNTTVTGAEKVTLELLGDVEIGSIKKIITPTGEITGTNGTYEITQNGEYKFTIVTDKDLQIEKTVNIQNIKEDGIDLTNLTTGEDITHNHIYEDKSDANNHWKQCYMCNDIQNQESHDSYIISSGTGSCESYLTDYCSKCGFTISNQYIAHNFRNYTKEELDAMGGNNTNTTTYIHRKAECTKCGAVSSNSCYDIDGNMISCVNRKVCTGCNFDYSTTTSISHTSTALKSDGKTYYCHYCNLEIYKQLHKWYDQDSSNQKHYVIYGIYQLNEGIVWRNTTLATYSPKLTIGAVTLTSAKVTDLPSSYYNNEEYGTTGITSGLYLVSYEATITDGYQGDVYVRLNADNCFGNVNNMSNEYGKTYATDFVLYPDTTAPSDLIVTVSGGTTENQYSTNVNILATCTDNYSDTVSMALYDNNEKCIIDYEIATASGKNFSHTFNVTNSGVEISEIQNYYVYFKDRFNNISKKEVSISYIDTKAPTIENITGINNAWAIRKNIKLEIVDKGIGNVSIAFNNPNNYELLKNIDGKYTKTYNFIGDVYEDIQGAIYLKDGLGNMRTEKIDIGKIDSTSPTITSATKTGTILTVTANDLNTELQKEGSGIAGYAISTTKELPGDSLFQIKNTFEVEEGRTYYVWVKDNAGNFSEVSEVK